MKYARLFASYSFRQLAALTGLSPMTLWRISQGKEPSRRSVEKLKKVKKKKT